MAKQLNVNLAFTADTGKARQQLQELQRTLSTLTVKSAQKSPLGLTDEINKAITDVAKLEVALKNATSHTGTLDLGQFRNEMNKANLSAEKIADQLAALGPEGKQAFTQLTRSITTAEVPLRRTSTLLTEFATTLKNTARWQLSSNMLHGFMGSIQTAYHYAEDLNESLNNIRIVTGQNVDQMAKFAQEANKAAQALNTTTTEYTNASLIYYQQGLSDEEVKARTDVTVKMANVARESAEDVSQQLTAVWNNFAKGGENLEYYADVMTALGAATASSTDEIAEGLEKFAAVANTVGLSYEYATAALATVTATTRQSADIVGNAFKTLFARIEGLKLGETLDDGTDLNKYSKALDAVGINIKNTNGDMKEMDQILEELGAKWGTLAKDQQMALAQTIAGVRQYTQLIALMDNWDFFQDNLDVARSSTGELQKQADIYAESWEAARDRVKASAEEIYNALLDDDFFIDINNGFAGFLNLINDTIEGLGGLQGVIPLVGAVLLKAFGPDLANSMQNITHNLQLMTAAGREQIVAERMNFVNQQRAMTDDGTISGAAQTAAYQQQADLQEKLIQKTVEIEAANGKISQSQQEQIQHLMDINAQLGDAYINTAKQREAQEALIQSQLAQTRQRVAAGDRGKFDTISKTFVQQQTQYSMGTKILADYRAAYDRATKGVQSGSEAQKKAFEDLIKSLQQLDQNLTDTGIDYELFKSQLQTAGQSTSLDELGVNLDGLESELEDFGSKAYSNFEKLDDALQSNGVSSAQAERSLNALTESANNAGIAAVNEARNFGAVSNQTQQTAQQIDNLENEQATLSQSFIGMAQGLTSIAMSISMIKGLGGIWSDKDTTYGEKILATITTIGMALPMIITGFTALKTAIADFPSAVISFATSMGVLTAAEGGASAGAVTLTGALTALWAAVWPIALVMAAVAAAVAGVIIAGKALYDAWNKDAIAAKEAAETAKGLAEEYDRVKSSYDELKRSLEDYNSAKDALDKLTEGTQEWEEAVIELNNQVLELLDKYPQLAGEISNVNGLLEISKRGQEDLLNAQTKKVRDAYQANLMGQSRANSTQIKSDATDLGRSIGYIDSQAVMASGYNDSGYRTISSDTIMKVVDAINKEGNSILENSEALMKATGVTEDQARALLETDNRNQLIALAEKVEANTTANELLAQQLGQSLLEEQGKENSEYAEQLAALLGREAQTQYNDKYAEEYRDRFGGKRDKTIQKEYADMMGYTWRDDLSGNKGEYLVNGEIVEIADEVARAALAQRDAQKEAVNQTDTYIAALKEVEKATGGAGNNVLNIIAGVDEGIDNLTKAEAEALADLDLSQLSEETRNALKITDINMFDGIIEEYDAAIQDIRSDLNQETRTIFDNLNLEDTTIAGQKAIATVLQRAVILGSDDAIQLITDTLKTSGVDAEVFAQTLANIDWENTSVDELKVGLENVGVATQYTDDQLQELIDSMRVTSDVTGNLIQRYADLKEVFDGLQTGDTISAEDYAALGELGNGFFTMMMDGTYKLTGDAEKFYETVQNNQIADFKNRIDDLSKKNDTLTNMQEYDYEGLSQNAAYQNQAGDWKFDSTTVQQQIDIIRELGDQSEDTQLKIAEWQNQLDNGHFENVQSLQEISDAVVACGGSFDTLTDTINNNRAEMLQMDIAIASSYDNFDDLRQALEDGTISLEAFNTAAVNLDKIKDIENLDPEELENFADYLQNIADSADDLADNMTEDASEIVAKGIMKMNDGIDELANNWEDWSSILEESSDSSEEYAEAMNGTIDAMSNLLDISEEFIDAEFVKDHMEDIKAAAEGDADAIDRLRDALVDPIVARIAAENDIDEGTLLAEVANLQSILDELGPLEVGAEVDDSSFIDACNEMIAASGMTTEQVNALFDAMGFEANFAEEGQPVQTKIPEYTTYHEPRQTGTVTLNAGTPDERTADVWTETSWTEQTGEHVADGEFTSFAFSTNGEVPKINSVVKKATGSSNNYSSKNSGGTKSSGGKSGGKKGGGGSKEKEPDKKDHKDPLEEIADRYHDINEAIEEVEHQMKMLDKTQSHLYGKELINSLKQQNALLSKQSELYRKKNDMLRQEQAELRNSLSAYGMSAGDDAIYNYQQTFDNIRNAYNAAVAEYNAVIDAYNAMTAEMQEQAGKAMIENAERSLENAKKLHDQAMENLKRYDAIIDELQSNEEKLQDMLYQQIENNLKAFQVEIEVKLDIKEARRTMNEFLHNIYKDFTKLYTKTEEWFDLFDKAKDSAGSFLGSDGTVQVDLGALKTVKDIIDNPNYAYGTEGSMFVSRSEAIKEYERLNEKLRDDAEEFYNLYKETYESYMDAVDEVIDQWNDIIDDFDEINDTLDHYTKVIELLYNSEDSALGRQYLDQLYDVSAQNSLAKQDTLRQQLEALQKERAEILAAGAEEADKDIAAIDEAIEDASKELESEIENYIDVIQNQFLNSIKTLMDTMDKAMTGGYGINKISERWEDAQKAAEDYYDDVERVYQIEQMESKWEAAIAKTSSLKNQQLLKTVMDEQIQALEDKNKLSEYDIGLAEKRLMVLQAQIALEEAQNNKNTMKLQRDTSGNWTYQYVADDEDVAQKQEDLLTALYEKYEYVKQANADFTQSIIETTQEAQERISEIMEQMTTADAERRAELEEELNYLYEYYYGEEGVITQNAQMTAQTLTDLNVATMDTAWGLYEVDQENYERMTENEKAMIDDLKEYGIDNLGELIRTIATDDGSFYHQMEDTVKEVTKDNMGQWKTLAEDIVNNWVKNPDSVQHEIENAYKAMMDALAKYDAAIVKSEQASGVEWTKVGKQLDQVAGKIQNVEDRIQAVINKTDDLSEFRSAVEAIEQAWYSVRDSIAATAAELEYYLSLLAEANSGGGGGDPSGGAVGGGGTGGSGGAGGSGGGSGGGDGRSLSSAEIEGIAGNVWVYGEWGNNPNRHALMKQKFGDANGDAIYNAVQAKFNSGYGYNSGLEHDWSYYKNYGPSAFLTGGYTGAWGESGRLGILHEKELVLNADDTKNMLSAVSTIRDIAGLNDSISSAIASSIGRMIVDVVAAGGSGYNTSTSDNTSNVFNITAEFPNADDVQTIREAILSLPNLASQYIRES